MEEEEGTRPSVIVCCDGARSSGRAQLLAQARTYQTLGWLLEYRYVMAQLAPNGLPLTAFLPRLETMHLLICPSSFCLARRAGGERVLPGEAAGLAHPDQVRGEGATETQATQPACITDSSCSYYWPSRTHTRKHGYNPLHLSLPCHMCDHVWCCV